MLGTQVVLARRHIPSQTQTLSTVPIPNKELKANSQQCAQQPKSRGGMYADWFVTAVRTGKAGAGGISMMLIPRSDAVQTKTLEGNLLLSRAFRASLLLFAIELQN